MYHIGLLHNVMKCSAITHKVGCIVNTVKAALNCELLVQTITATSPTESASMRHDNLITMATGLKPPIEGTGLLQNPLSHARAECVTEPRPPTNVQEFKIPGHFRGKGESRIWARWTPLDIVHAPALGIGGGDTRS